MSLINQMLQDLDARRSETTGSDAYGVQIRAVPKRQRIHPAWWVVSGLIVALAGTVGWVALRPPVAVAMQPAMQPVPGDLPLKFDSTLSLGSQRVALHSTAGQQPVAALGIAGDALAPTTVSSEQATDFTAAPVKNIALAAPAPIEKATDKVANKAIEKNLRLPAEAADSAAVSKERAAIPELTKVGLAAKSPDMPTPAVSYEPATPMVIAKQIKELTPAQRAENEYRKAVQLVQQGKGADAISGLEQALQLDALHAAARHTLIGVLLENKRPDDALRKARDGLELDPAQPALAMILARLQMEKGELRHAIETLERSRNYATEKADYQAFLAALLQREEKHKQASEYYMQALRRAPQTGVWWMGLGISLQAENRTAEAQEAFMQAKATNTLSPELLAFVDSRMKQLQSAK